MVMLRKWEAKIEHGIWATKVIFECPFFDELVMPKGQLTPHFECHALWDYYGNASKAFDMAEKNFVYEDENSRVFTMVTARQLFESIAKKHGVKPVDMVNFWPHVDKQRIAMGGAEGLPEQFKFKYWGH